MTAPVDRRFRFRPRYTGLAWFAIAVGAALAVFGVTLDGPGQRLALVTGAIGAALGALYLLSPAWRIEVVITDAALEVLARGERRFLLAWDEVARVIASPSTRTCFVDGGHPDRSLLVPGMGASAPYRIEDAPALYEAVLAHVPADAVVEVELIETAKRELAERDAERPDVRDSDASERAEAGPEPVREPDSAGGGAA